MYFNKLFASALAITTLLVSSISHAKVEIHLARRWIDVQKRDLEAEIRSLDEDWAIQRRDLQLELRSLDALTIDLSHVALQSRELLSKASAKTSGSAGAKTAGAKTAGSKAAGSKAAGSKAAESKLPGSKTAGAKAAGTAGKTGGHAKHLVSRKCSKKSAAPKKGKRAGSSIVVDVGQVKSGGADDELKTWNLRVCIGMAAVTSGGKQKVLAHINALQGNVDYEQQIQNFKSLVNSNARGARITVSFPDQGEAPAGLQDRQGEIVREAERVASELDSGYTAVDREPGEIGAMTITKAGIVDTCD